MEVGGGGDGGGERGSRSVESVMYEVLRPAVSGREVVEDGVEGQEAGAGEDRTVAQGPGTGGLVLQPLTPGQADLAAVRLVLTGRGQLGGQPLCRQRSDGAEGGAAERTEAGLAVTGAAGQVAVVTLIYPGRGAGEVTHGTLQHLPRALHQLQGSRDSFSTSTTALSHQFSLLQHFEQSSHRLRQISSQSRRNLIGRPRLQPLYTDLQQSGEEKL